MLGQNSRIDYELTYIHPMVITYSQIMDLFPLDIIYPQYEIVSFMNMPFTEDKLIADRHMWPHSGVEN